MSIKTKEWIEIISVYVAIFLIVFVFVLFAPNVFSSNVGTPFIILYELLPYILMVSLVIVVCKIAKRPLAKYLGFSKVRLTKQILIGVIIAVLTSMLIVIPLLMGVNKTDVLNFKPSSSYVLAYYIFKAIIFVGIGEELIFRGYFYEKIKEMSSSGVWAVVLSSILFGVWHYPNGQSVLQVIILTGLGLIYGFARLKVKNCTVLAIGIAHGLHDTFILLLSYLLL